MDLVNSVTQNSNNHNVPMENSGDGDGFSSNDGNDGNSGNANNNKSNDQSSQSMAAASSDDATSSPALANQPEDDSKSSSTSSQQTSSSSTTTNNNNSKQQQEAPKSQMPDYLKAIGMDPRKFWPKKYRFTREKPPGQYNPLTIAQRNFYESNGYLVVDGCASPRLVEQIRRQHSDGLLIREFLLDKLAVRNHKMIQLAKCFCDERLMLMTHNLLESFQTSEQARAQLDEGRLQRQQVFRDWLYLPFRPIDKVVCTLTAIDELDHALMVVPGTHRVGQCSISSTLESITAAYETSQERGPHLVSRELFEAAPENLSALVERSKRGFKYVNLKPGQTLFYHPGLIHGFCDDLINYKRRQLACVAYYAAADCEYVDLKRSADFISGNKIPISLSHFGESNPSDYTSWIGKPRLLHGHDDKANL